LQAGLDGMAGKGYFQFASGQSFLVDCTNYFAALQQGGTGIVAIPDS